MTTRTRLLALSALTALALAPAGSALAAGSSWSAPIVHGHSVDAAHEARDKAQKPRKAKKPKVVKLQVSGTLTVVDAEAGRLTVSKPARHHTVVTMSFGVDARTVVERDEVPATLADLVVGDRVSAKLLEVGEVATATRVSAETAETEDPEDG